MSEKLKWGQRTFQFTFPVEVYPETFARVAHHPRLNVPMRLVDVLFFQAEHDDYHLARISELIRAFQL